MQAHSTFHYSLMTHYAHIWINDKSLVERKATLLKQGPWPQQTNKPSFSICSWLYEPPWRVDSIKFLQNNDAPKAASDNDQHRLSIAWCQYENPD